MTTLKFKGFKAKLILDGYKTSTMRLFDDKDIKAWQDLEFVNSDTGEVFAHAVSTEVTEKKLSELNDIDFEGHETWDSPEAMLKNFQGYYGDTVTMDTPVKVIKFKLV